MYSQNQKNIWKPFWKIRLPISNNLCEAAIRALATARRAWLCTDTPKGAREANAVLYTLIESARANYLNVFEYLRYLLAELSNRRYFEHPDVLDEYLPWSMTSFPPVQEEA